VANTPIITVNGYELRRWSTITIDRSIDALADTFSIEYHLHDRASLSEVNPLTFDGDERVQIAVDGDVMLTGSLDVCDVDLSPEGDVVNLSGYSATGDLVACPVEPRPLRFVDKSIEFIVATLCEPFGVDVIVDATAVEDAQTVLQVFKAEFGEPVFEAIARAANYRGLLTFSSPTGGLILARAGQARVGTVLELGRNLTRVRVTRDSRDRYSDYYVTSPNAGRFDPDDSGADGKVARVQDLGVGRYRPTIITAETDVKTQARRRQQGEWERNRRVGDSLRIVCEFPQWRCMDGELVLSDEGVEPARIRLWDANDRVGIKIDKRGLRIDRDMIVSTVSFTRDAQSSKCSIELVHPDSVNPRKIPLPRRAKTRQRAAADVGDGMPDPDGYPVDEDFGPDFGETDVYAEDVPITYATEDPFEGI